MLIACIPARRDGGYDARQLGGRGFGGSFGLHGRTRILAALVGIAVDELDNCHRRRIAIAEARFEHAGVAALAIAIARTQDVEQLLHLSLIPDLGNRLAAGVEAALLG